ncbi:MAG TPA: AI-2E family transporter [Candidatus Baltobacteraceae bacterium]|nr:AI-2E family transporter [Candidatus Baltobacteraceae bacterium]
MNRPSAVSYIALAVLALVVWYAHIALLLVFGGMLLSLVLRRAAEWVSKAFHIHIVLAVWGTAAAGALVAGVGMAVLGNAVAAQMATLRDALPAAFSDVLQHLRSTPIGIWIASNVPNASVLLSDGAHLLSRAGGVLSGALGAFAAILAIIFVSIAGALEPDLYVNGFVQLFPASRRGRIRSVLIEVGNTLRTWFAARLFTMTVTATLVTVGLTILHIPLAVGLGILAGVLAFVPNIGAFVAAAPALLLAFVQGPSTAIAVAVMYVTVHILDDFLVAPFVERQIVRLPPILTLTAQIVLGVAAGAFGVMMAAPLVAAAIVIVQRLWVEDVADPAPINALPASRLP